MILLTDKENPYHKGLMKIDRVSEDAFNEGAKAQLKKVVEDMDKYIVGVDNEGLKMKATPDCALKWWQSILEGVR
ncbi:hypothetical protein LCGC14_0387580 [marine sediment metagenome]|uniref:Uncharacterized protein n=1 Tax=marine sediment metagenome TaxID=412755 RepID=A0A0F9VMJ9_9ZZZZ